VRAKVEHPFSFVKNLFRHRKMRYRCLAENTAAAVCPVRFRQLGLWLAGASRNLKPELRLERAKVRNAGQIYQLQSFINQTDAKFRPLARFAASKKRTRRQ
jgi:hypothetical protein